MQFLFSFRKHPVDFILIDAPQMRDTFQKKKKKKRNEADVHVQHFKITSDRRPSHMTASERQQQETNPFWVVLDRRHTWCTPTDEKLSWHQLHNPNALIAFERKSWNHTRMLMPLEGKNTIFSHSLSWETFSALRIIFSICALTYTD